MDTATQSHIRNLFDGIKTHAVRLRTSTISERKSALKKLEDWIMSHRWEIHEAVFNDLQKPHHETDLTEVYVVLAEIRKARKNLKSWMAPKPAATSLTYLGTKAETFYEPKGACLIIAPWNYPFQLATGPLVSAIAAGNTAIIKPSEFSENTSELIRRMCNEVFRPGEVSVVLGAVDESQELLSLPFDHIFFTGSPQVGKIVMSAAAKHLASVTLELGGKSPTIVDETASIKDAAQKIAWGKWQNAGQVCIAPDYLYVHEDVKEKLIEELVIQSEKLYGNKNTYGAIISRHHHNRINDLMADAIDKGANIEFGGKSDREHLRFTPTLLSNVSANCRIMEEEIFGPILPLVSFREIDEVISFVNQKPKPLALYLFSNKKSIIQQVKKETSAGMMAINDVVLQFAHPNLPIGGVNNSGIGKAHGHAGFIAFSNEKAIVKQRKGWTMAKTVYPPYSKFKKFMIDLMVKYF
ncbi:aldehyde dehydrogenase (NAD+) [Ekhidna lutea]|uniref:Aldehyde dehydrogenase n=1 Tax=Ekhidna lutea TaxID=447679 RepID=A0A239EW85_EKHLU|nr:aldehyde dehydrogenase family protein [Ekhidna lutea]SNS48303.1 aldehyde dehydrogenase (NAD+) [Ekhidna lutea]